jgi:hypothetical protein
VFKDQEPRKKKSIIGWEAKEKLKKSMVETIQHMQTINPPPNLPIS